MMKFIQLKSIKVKKNNKYNRNLNYISIIKEFNIFC